MSLLDIGTVARRSGLTPAALRFYEQRGLIAPASRLGLRRQYDPAVLERLALVTLAQRAGFSLDEIAGMFGRNGMPDLPRDVLHGKADAIDRQIRELTTLRDTLRHVADCPAPSHLDCPTFRRLVELAGKRGKAGARKRGGRAPPGRATRAGT